MRKKNTKQADLLTYDDYGMIERALISYRNDLWQKIRHGTLGESERARDLLRGLNVTFSKVECLYKLKNPIEAYYQPWVF